MNTAASLNRSWCADCRSFVRGSLVEHSSTKRHFAATAPRVNRRGARSIARAEQRARLERAARVDSYLVDEEQPADTWKMCRGIPSLEIEAHFEPLEAFHRNRAYADGFYVRCHSCHQYYLWSLAQRKAAAKLEEVALVSPAAAVALGSES